jgi:peptide/nickel transport system permease protein
LSASGEQIEAEVIEALEERFGLGQPMHIQYVKWIGNIITKGDFGQSFAWNTPVEDLIWGRLGLTLLISIATLLFTWVIAFPVGIYSAVNKYSIGDYIATFLGFLGLAVPNFLLALVLMFVAWVVLTGICGSPMEYGKSTRFGGASMDSDDYFGDGRCCELDSYYAREPT